MNNLDQNSSRRRRAANQSASPATAGADAPVRFGFPSGSSRDPADDTLPLSERTAAKILALQASRNGGRPFVLCDSKWLTYYEANQRANGVGNALLDLGVPRGARVCILMDNRLEFLDLWFGLSKIGAIQMPMNSALKARQILQVLQRAPVHSIVAEESLMPELAMALSRMSRVPPVIVLRDQNSSSDADVHPALATIDYGTLIAAAPTTPVPGEEEISGQDAGAIMNTSGTTGPPKGVLMSHAQQYILGRNIAADLDIGPDDVYYNFFPLFHNTAQAMITIPVLLNGARMVMRDRFSASGFWPDVARHGCTVFYYIAEILRILVKSNGPEDKRSTSLRAAWGIGGSAADYIEFQERYGVRLGNGYGSTEANVPCFMPPDHAKPGSAGRVIPGFELRIADESGQAQPCGRPGEILVRSAEPYALMLEYDGDPAATVAAWRDLWYHSGDAGYLDEDGFLFFTGRVKDVIRVRGESVSAFEIEQAIADIEGVLEVAVIAVPSELGSDDIKAVIVLADGASVTHEAVISHIEPVLPRYCLPRYLEFAAELPKTPTNKVRKHELRKTPFSKHTWNRTTGRLIQIIDENH